MSSSIHVIHDLKCHSHPKGNLKIIGSHVNSSNCAKQESWYYSHDIINNAISVGYFSHFSRKLMHMIILV